MFTFLVDDLTPETKINIEATGTFGIHNMVFWTYYQTDTTSEE